MKGVSEGWLSPNEGGERLRNLDDKVALGAHPPALGMKPPTLVGDNDEQYERLDFGATTRIRSRH